MDLISILDHIGVVVFAISGAMAAAERRMDLFGAVVLATITAVGGGTLRDLVMGNTPVFWVTNPSYILASTSAAFGTLLVAHWRPINRSTLAIADAFGLGLFTVLGTSLAISQGLSPVIAVVMGVMTGVFGGVARDVLANDVPLILREEIYATAALFGAVAWIALDHFSPYKDINLLLGGGLTVLIRLLALKYHLSLPLFPEVKGHRRRKP